MKYFTRIRSYKLICYVLVFLMGAPTMLIAPIPAAAQADQLVEVAVVDFINRTGVGGDYIGKLASDALVVELKNSERFSVATRAAVQAGMDDLGFKAPLSRSQLLRLSEKVLKGDLGGASAMVEGDVTNLKVRGNPRRAEVDVIVRMVDSRSGEVINGAVVTGRSQVRIGDNPDDDRLIEEAVNDAAYTAVKTMVQYIIPEATVMNTMGTNEVLLNKGAREGIKRGMRMIVMRRGEMVGTVEVKDVTPNDATASVVSAPKGVKPEDKVRAIFDVPQPRGSKDPSYRDPAPEPSRSSSAPKSNSGKSKGKSKILVGLLVLAGLAALVRPGRGTESVGGVTARAGISPDIPGGATEGGVMVTFNPDKLGGGRNILEYHIWRDGDPTPVGVVLLNGQNYFVDEVGTGTRAVSYTLVDPVANTKSTQNAAAAKCATGVPHQYFVSAVYQIEKPAGSGTFKFFETDKASTGLATVTRRILNDPADMFTPAAPPEGQVENLIEGVTVSFASRNGGDTYIVQISRNPLFTRPEYTSTVISSSPNAEPAAITFNTGNIASKFGTLADDTQLWWRVGVRNSMDNPGPVASMGKAGMNFLFSSVKSFTVAATPPDQP